MRAGAWLRVTLDGLDRVTAWDDACVAATGRSREDTLGATLPVLCTEPARVREQLAAARRGDGGRVLATCAGRRIVLVAEPAGEGGALTLTGLDVTEEAAPDGELQARLDAIVDIAADAIVSVDEHQRIVIYNEGARSIFGWSAEEAVGRPLDLLIPPAHRGVHRDHVARFTGSPRTSRRMGERDVPLQGIRKSGEVFPAEAAISRVEVGGRAVSTVILRDVSERHRAELALRHSEEEHRLLAHAGAVLISASPDAEATLRALARLAVAPDGLADWFVVELDGAGSAGRRVEVAHRDPAGAALAQEIRDLQLDRHQPTVLAPLREAARAVAVPEVTPAWLAAAAQSPTHADVLARLRIRSLVGAPLVARGRRLGAFVALSSREERRYDERDARLVEQLAGLAALAVDNAQLYEAARRAVAARDDVVRVVAHDLRNPVFAAQLGTRGLLGELDAVQREIADRVDEALTRASRLIDDLLDVARIEGGGPLVEPEPVAPAALVGDAVRAMAPLAAAAGVALRTDAATDALPAVLADRGRVHQVLSNLIGNAIKFTPAGGAVVVAADRRDGAVALFVRDTGPGISADQLPHLFDRFWQGRRGDRRGAGLGLPIAKGLVEAHGGRIWAESAPGEGATLWFTLPEAGA